MNEMIHKSLVLFSNQPYFISNLIKSLLLLGCLLLIRSIVTKWIERLKGIPLESRRRWVVNVRNITVAVFAAGLFLIWVYQIKEFAFSIAAIAIACVMIFKEMITNFMGGIARTISHQYGVGDRISVGDFRGDVIDTDMLTTTILEIGPGKTSHQYTGSTISIPNTMLLNTPVINESYMYEYLLHTFRVPVKADKNWRRTEKFILMAANSVCEPYLKKARTYMEGIAKKTGVESPSADPRTSIIFTNPDEIELLVRVPVPSRRKGKIEQEIVRKYLDLLENEENLSSVEEGAE